MRWIALAAVLLAPILATAQTVETLSPAAVRSDLSTLRQILLDSHYAPFAYTSPEALDAEFEGLMAEVGNAPLTRLDAYRLLQAMSSTVKNGHTTVDFPVPEYLSYADAGGTIFPLEVALENGKAIVRADFSDGAASLVGRELVSINGQPIAEVLETIYPLASAERTYYAHAKIELLTLPRFYWYAFGSVPEFAVTLRDAKGITTSQTLVAIPAMDNFEMVRTDILGAGRTLSFPEEREKTAYLRPGDFSGDEAEYRAFVDNAFSEITERDTDTLIIDLRNNGGGNDSFSDYLVAYIADQPFRWYGDFKVRTSEPLKAHAAENMDAESAFTQAILSKPSGEHFDFDFSLYPPRAEALRFTGAVYVLVNRQSHSQAAVTAAQIQDYGWGVVVGEETAEYPSLYASQFAVVLPETGITVRISKGHIIRVNGDQSQTGVQPDIVVRDHLLDDTDEIMGALMAHLARSP